MKRDDHRRPETFSEFFKERFSRILDPQPRGVYTCPSHHAAKTGPGGATFGLGFPMEAAHGKDCQHKSRQHLLAGVLL